MKFHESMILKAITAEPWAITEDGLQQILTIAQREHDVAEAVRSIDGQNLNNSQDVEIRDNGTAIIPITGPIFRYANLFTRISGATSIDVLAKDIQKAVDDPQVKSIVFEIDSPGGQVTGVADTAQMIANIKKPTTAFIGGTGASAAYWLASAADTIVASQTALVGSIGVLLSVAKDEDDKIHIVSSQSPNKRVDVKTDDGRSQVQAMVDELASVFISAVAKYRGVDEDTVLSDFGKGSVKVAGSALLSGMIDSIGLLETLIAGFTGESTSEVIAMSKEDNDNLPEVTVEYIKLNHPAVAQSLIAEGAQSVKQDDLIAKGRSEGAESERARIKGVLDVSLSGHEQLVKQLAFDGQTSPAEAALKVLEAEKSARGTKLETLATEGDLGVDHAPTGDEPTGDFDDLDAETRWEKDAALRAEFNNNKEDWLAFDEANSNGQVKILNHK